jgi:cAMP-dependent protein kinase regulator
MNEEQKEYIEKKLNPVLESLVEKVLDEMPEHVMDFIKKHFLESAATNGVSSPGDAGEVAALQKEVAALKKEVAEKHQYCSELERVIIQIAPPAKGDGSNQIIDDMEDDVAPPPPEEEEEEEDDEMEIEIAEYTGGKQKARTSVSAEAYGAWNKKLEFQAKVYAKSPAERETLEKILRESFLFSGLPKEDMNTVVDGMKSESVKAGATLIQQGDDGNELYVVESGTLNCFVNTGSGGEKQVMTVKTGEIVGELALLYNCPRAASVRADGDVKCWALDRETFNAIVKDAAAKAREMREAFLKKVTLLSSLDAYDRSRLADSLRPETFAKGDYIIRAGDAGDRMFLVEEGELEATRALEKGGAEEVVMTYRPGDYFGELAVLRNTPRKANVIARSPVKVYSLLAKDFHRLCGSLEERMLQTMSTYR